MERSRGPAPRHLGPGAVRLLDLRRGRHDGFIAAFVAGMAFGTVDHHNDEAALRFTEQAGTLLSLLVWFIFGAVMLVPGIEDLGWRDVVFALLALTLLRMVPVAIALAGTGLDRATVAFVGWFGPRGLASVVFGLIAVDSLAPSDSKVVLAAVTLTVALSVLLHGVSASPLAATLRRLCHPVRSRGAGAHRNGTHLHPDLAPQRSALRRPRPPPPMWPPLPPRPPPPRATRGSPMLPPVGRR